MKILLFGKINGSGLETDKKILESELMALGHEVIFYNFLLPIPPAERGDLNIHLEAINEKCLDRSSYNIFIPNPEWYIQDMDLLDKIDLIACKTHEAERIFNEMGYKTIFLGFTSPDCLEKSVKKDYNHFFHMRGSSDTKGSVGLIKAWMVQTEPSLPFLTVTTHIPPGVKSQLFEVIDHRLPNEEYSRLINSCGVHLCPSETEGFGHSLVEAMSTEAVVITVNAPPMNELIDNPWCLVPYKHTQLCQLGLRYFFDSRDLVKVIRHLMTWPEEKLRTMGLKNREKFLKMDQAFKTRLKEILELIGES